MAMSHRALILASRRCNLSMQAVYQNTRWFHFNTKKFLQNNSNPSLYSHYDVTKSHKVVGSCRYLASKQTAASKIAQFKLINGEIDKNSPTYRENLEKYEKRVAKYEELMKTATSGGSEKAVERHTVKNKKLLVEERLRQLFDNKDDVLELSPLAGLGMKYGDIPRAGGIFAIGRVSGVYCLVIANDATIKAGTVYPITLKKQLRAMEVCQQNGLPCIYVVDSGGAYLPLQADIFGPGGRTFYNEAVSNSMGIPQLAIVCGSCTAGAAYIPTMCQEAVIVDRIGTIFLAGPPLVKAALGEVVSPEELGGAKMHSSVSGCTDYYCTTESEAFETSRATVSAFNIETVCNTGEYEEPLYSSDELMGLVPADNSLPIDIHKYDVKLLPSCRKDVKLLLASGRASDIKKVLARLVDGSRFHEFKATYAPSIVTGFCHLHGHLIGVVGNNGSLTGDAALKASHFVQLCSQRRIPLVFLQHIIQAASSSTTQEEGIRIRNHSTLMSAVVTCDVPFITVIIGNSRGVESYMMGGRSFGPRFLFSWPNANICIDEPERVVNTVTQSLSAEGVPSDKSSEILKDLREDLEEKSSAFYSSCHAWDDGMILPHQTRKVLGQCLDILKQNSIQQTSAQKSVIRM